MNAGIMKHIFTGFLTFFLVTGMCFSTAMALDKITVAYFPGWPLTHEVGWSKGWFDKELGIKVDFREFDTGPQMSAAMASGDVQISYSLGAIPFTVAATQGVPFKLIGIAVSYAAADNCVARDDSGVVSPRDLIGKTVGVPYGTVSHYKLLGTLDIFSINPNDVKIIDMAPQDAVAAFKRKDLDCGCSWEPAVSEMIASNGHLIISAEDQERWGLKVFDIVVATDSFAKEHPDLVIKFLKVVDDSTKFFYEHPEESYKLIGEKAGITPERTKSIMDKMLFMTKEKQLSQTWLGTSKKPGDVTTFMKNVADFLVKQKALDKALENYTSFVDPSFYESVP